MYIDVVSSSIGYFFTYFLLLLGEMFEFDEFKKNEATRNVSGQIIATSHDLTPNGGLIREIPLFQGNLGW